MANRPKRKILSFEGRRQLLHIPTGLRCFAKSYIEKIFAQEREIAGVSRDYEAVDENNTRGGDGGHATDTISVVEDSERK